MKAISVDTHLFATTDLKPAAVKSWGPIKVLDDGRLVVKHGPASRKGSVIFPQMLLDAVVRVAAKDEEFRTALIKALTQDVGDTGTLTPDTVP